MKKEKTCENLFAPLTGLKNLSGFLLTLTLQPKQDKNNYSNSTFGQFSISNKEKYFLFSYWLIEKFSKVTNVGRISKYLFIYC